MAAKIVAIIMKYTVEVEPAVGIVGSGPPDTYLTITVPDGGVTLGPGVADGPGIGVLEGPGVGVDCGVTVGVTLALQVFSATASPLIPQSFWAVTEHEYV